MHDQSPDSVPTTDSKLVNHPLYASGSAEGGESRLKGFLESSGLTPADVGPGWQYRTATEVKQQLGLSRAVGAGVEIQYYSIDGTSVHDRGLPFRRIRLLDPPAGRGKYLSRAGSSGHIYIPQGFHATAQKDAELEPGDRVGAVVVTEGEKKAERLVKLGIPSVAIAGVHMWADPAARDEQKAEAEAAGEKAPRLNKHTPVHPELVSLLRGRASKVVVLLDSDGAELDESQHDEQTLAALKPAFKTVSSDDERLVLNPSVCWAGRTLAAALRRSVPRLPVASAFVPLPALATAPAEPEAARHLLRRGVDDWSMEVDRSEIVRFLREAVVDASDVTEEQIKKEEEEARRQEIAKTQGFVPLGYSDAGEDGVVYYLWARTTCSPVKFTDSKLQRKPAYLVLGEQYCDELLGKEVCVRRGDEEKGIPPKFEMKFDLDTAQRRMINQCLDAGRWSPGSSIRGAGAWRDEDGSGLLINCAQGIYHVLPDGSVNQLKGDDRVQKKWIYAATDKGVWPEKEGTSDDVRTLISFVEESWNWESSVDGTLAAGWLLMQPFAASLEARPHLQLNGESQCGKTHLSEFAKALAGNWGYRVKDAGSQLTPAGLAQHFKRDAMTVFLDEIEPGDNVSPEEAERANRRIRQVQEMLRSTFDEDDDENTSNGLMGTASQESVTRQLRVCALKSSVNSFGMSQQDMNRTIILEMQKLTEGHKERLSREKTANAGADPDLALAQRLGGPIYRRMWPRWSAFRALVPRLAGQIDHHENRMQVVLGSAVAAIAAALDLQADDPLIERIIRDVNETRGGAAAQADSPRAGDKALQALLAAVIDVDGAKQTVADAAVDALNAGLGKPGRGSGGPAGDALRRKGLTARRNGDGTVSLFVAQHHPEVQQLAGDLRIFSLEQSLRRVDGAEEVKRDNRVRLGTKDGNNARWYGVWIPAPLSVIAEAETSPPDDKKGHSGTLPAAAPY